MSDETHDTLRDLRKPGFFQIDNEIVEDFELSPHEFAVYAAICYHASTKTQKAWPGMATIAKEMGMSRRKVIDCIKELERLKLIYVKRETKDDGTRKVNHYSLLDVKALVRKGSEPDALPSESDALGVVHEVHKNKTHLEQHPPTNNGASDFNAFKEEVVTTFSVNGQRAASIALMLLGRSHEFKYAKYDIEPAMTLEELRRFASWYRNEFGGIRLPTAPEKIEDKIVGFRANGGKQTTTTYAPITIEDDGEVATAEQRAAIREAMEAE